MSCEECPERQRCHPYDETLDDQIRTERLCNIVKRKVKQMNSRVHYRDTYD